MIIKDRSMDRSSMEKKKKWVYSSARKKAEKESSLYFETARFVCHFYRTCNQDERKVLDVVSLNIIDIYRNYYNKVFYPPKPNKTSYKVNFNEDDVSAIIHEYRSLVENELNYLFQNMINVDTKQTIKDFIPDFKQGDITKHSHIWDYWSCLKFPDDDDIFAHNRTGNGRRKKKMMMKKKKKSKAKAPKLTQLELHQQRDAQVKLQLKNQVIIEQEANHYKETIMLLQHFSHYKEATHEERVSLHRAYINVIDVLIDLEDSWVHPDVSLMIKEHRLKVEEELNYVCNNVSNATIIEDYRRLLADFQTGPKPKEPPSQIDHPHLQDMSCQEDGIVIDNHMSSGEGSSKPLPICDDQLYYYNHDKCCRPPSVDEAEPIDEVIEWIEAENDECTDLTFGYRYVEFDVDSFV